MCVCICLHVRVYAYVFMCASVCSHSNILNQVSSTMGETDRTQDFRQAVGLSFLFFILYMEILMSCPLSNLLNKVQCILESQPLLMELGSCFKKVYTV